MGAGRAGYVGGVPRVPPELAHQYVDALRYIDASGRLRETMPPLGLLADRVKGLTADAFAPAGDGVRDHSIQRYIAALDKNIT
ncbi:hypothetical protein [Streptomyces sp. NPDC051219]|uniref:hypothetical protein n=1 Tax=Streptomyces sp. NPDC051219 TaxID=3155283 RepID=UPI0034371EBD